ncbi:hypothetical protein QQP08_006330, partial [Theobroma cacao]
MNTFHARVSFPGFSAPNFSRPPNAIFIRFSNSNPNSRLSQSDVYPNVPDRPGHTGTVFGNLEKEKVLKIASGFTVLLHINVSLASFRGRVNR